MEQTYFMISDAAKKVEVETHVLRYWEEELNLTIKRNELGHRHYTKEDVERFIGIKQLKEQGFQLKAIRMILLNGNLNRIGQDGKLINTIESNSFECDKKETSKLENNRKREELNEDKQEEKITEELVTYKNQGFVVEGKEEKALRLQQLLKKMISEAVRENNQEICDDIKSSVLKELDYQFRAQEEKEEEREKIRREREEEHYKRLDEILRSRSNSKRKKRKFIIT